MRVGGVSHWGGRRYLEGWEAVATFAGHMRLTKSSSTISAFLVSTLRGSRDLSVKDRQQFSRVKTPPSDIPIRCRLNQFKSVEKIPCPDDLTYDGIILERKVHFKSHTTRVHDFFLSHTGKIDFFSFRGPTA
jgi:hypothetical protein